MSSILVVDDDDLLRRALEDYLRSCGHVVRACGDPSEAIARIRAEDVEVALVDFELPEMTGVTLCRRLREERPDVPVIVLTAFGSFDVAVAAMRAGAYDFLSKPARLDDLSAAVDRAAAHAGASARARRLDDAVGTSHEREGDDRVVSANRAMRDLLDLVARVAPTEATVLISGESGTGKEILAREIHRSSRRRSGPFVAINCAAMTESLLESELFGHIRGAFTDARTRQDGLLVVAKGGTLFLDEIGEMPLSLQPKLLRALQERVVRPIGGSAEVPIDVRLVAATNRDLEQAMAAGSFRSDLFYRLDVVRITIPPLRARPEDILPFAAKFIATYRQRSGKPVVGMLPDTTERLLAYPWPGNVRELQNCIERAIALTKLDRLAPCDLPEKIAAYRPGVRPSADPAMGTDIAPLDQMEREHITRVLDAFAGNKSAAARALGIDRKRLYRLLSRFGGGD